MANQYSQMSPGVLISELDLSARVQVATSTTGGMVFESKRGTLKPKFVPSVARFEESFGKPDPSVSFAHDCARAFLLQSSQLWCQRVVNGALHAGLTYYRDRYSKLAVDAAADRVLTQPFPIGKVAGYEAGAQQFAVLSFAGSLITANTFTITMTDGATSTTTSPVTYATSHNYTLGLIAAAINTALSTFGDNAQCIVRGEGTGVNSYVIMIYLPTNVTITLSAPTVASGATQTTARVDQDARLIEVFAENPGVWGNNIGTKLTNFDVGTRQRFRMTLGGPMLTGHSIQVTVNDTVIGPINYATSSDDTLAAFAAALRASPYLADATVTSVPGAKDNDRVITVIAKDAAPNALRMSGLQVLGTNAPASILLETLKGVYPTNEFDFEVFDRSNVVTPIERFRSTMAKATSSNGYQTALDFRLNMNDGDSKTLRVAVPDSVRSYVFTPHASGSTYAIDDNVKFLGGGDDGAKVFNSQLANGWNAFRNREKIAVRILINAGYTDPTVQQAMVALAEYRNDSVAVLDLPSNRQSPQSAYNFRLQDLNIDSSFGALYGPDLLITDDDSDDLRYIPPSGHVAAAYAYSDANAAVWFAPAGLNRGKLPQVRGLRYDYELGDRELLDPVGINCIINKPGAGPVIWAEETLQLKKSVLSTVHARRLLNALEIAYADALNYAALFEPNNVFTRYNVRQVGEGLLAPIKREGGLYNYLIVCDERNNPADIIDQELLRVDIYLDIVRTAKRVLLRAVLTRTGANFAELVQLVNGTTPASAGA